MFVSCILYLCSMFYVRLNFDKVNQRLKHDGGTQGLRHDMYILGCRNILALYTFTK